MNKASQSPVPEKIAPRIRNGHLTLNIRDITSAPKDPSYEALDETFGAGAFRLSTDGRDTRLAPTYIADDGTECDTAEQAEQHNVQEVKETKTGSLVISLIFGGICAIAETVSAARPTSKAYGSAEVAVQLIPQSKDAQQIIVTSAKFASQTPKQQLEFVSNADSFSCRAQSPQSASILDNDAILNSFSATPLIPGFIDNTKITKVSFQNAAMSSVLNTPKLAPTTETSLFLTNPAVSGASFMDLAAPQPRPH